eukprot:6200653-Pleurochrysis_carterae.AAC.4
MECGGRQTGLVEGARVGRLSTVFHRVFCLIEDSKRHQHLGQAKRARQLAYTLPNQAAQMCARA